MLEISPSNGSKIDFLDTLKIKSNLPITEVNKDYIQIFDIDTLEVTFSTEIDKNLDFIYLNFDKVPNDLYQIQILPNAINDFLGSTMIQFFIKTTLQKLKIMVTFFDCKTKAIRKTIIDY